MTATYPPFGCRCARSVHVLRTIPNDWLALSSPTSSLGRLVIRFQTTHRSSGNALVLRIFPVPFSLGNYLYILRWVMRVSGVCEDDAAGFEEQPHPTKEPGKERLYAIDN